MRPRPRPAVGIVWPAALVVLAALYGCSVTVAELDIAAPRMPSREVLHAATSRGWREGESCRLWVIGIPFGLPQIDEAMTNALKPVDGAFLRHVTVYSEHPVYVVYGWHCYRVTGEAFG